MGRILTVILTLLLLGAWVLGVVVDSDYDEATAIQLGFLWFLAALALSWNTRRRWLKVTALLLLVAVMLTLGVLARRGGVYRTNVRVLLAQNMLEQVARSLNTYRTSGQNLPTGDWMSTAQLLQQSGSWQALRIPYQGRTETADFATIPRSDPWGCRYRYQASGERFTLASSGPDRRWNTPDDLVVNDGTPLPAAPRPLPVFALSKNKTR